MTALSLVSRFTSVTVQVTTGLPLPKTSFNQRPQHQHEDALLFRKVHKHAEEEDTRIAWLCPALTVLTLLLMLVRDKITNMKRHECTTCARDLPLAQFPKLPEDGSCTHDNDTCKRCWHQWLQSQVASKTPDQISCAQCSNVLGQGEIRALATKKVYERYVPPQTI